MLGGELEAQHAAYRKALGRVDPEIVDGECRAFLRKHGLSVDPISDAYHAVGLVILKAHVRAYGLLLQRHEGEPIETPAPPVPAAASKGQKLSEAFEAWKAGSGARGGKKPSDRTLLEASYAVRRLTEWHGDIRLGDLTRELARDFRDALVAVVLVPSGSAIMASSSSGDIVMVAAPYTLRVFFTLLRVRAPLAQLTPTPSCPAARWRAAPTGHPPPPPAWRDRPGPLRGPPRDHRDRRQPRGGGWDCPPGLAARLPPRPAPGRRGCVRGWPGRGPGGGDLEATGAGSETGAEVTSGPDPPPNIPRTRDRKRDPATGAGIGIAPFLWTATGLG